MTKKESELHEKRYKDLISGKKTLNQIRKEMGLPPISSGDIKMTIPVLPYKGL